MATIHIQQPHSSHPPIITPHFYTKCVYRILARGCGRQHKAWGGAQRNPRYVQHLSRKPADAGDSHWLNLNDDEMANNKKLPGGFAGLMCNYAISLGLRLTPRPRLYAAARIRGLRTRQNVGNDKALPFRPRKRAEILRSLIS